MRIHCWTQREEEPSTEFLGRVFAASPSRNVGLSARNVAYRLSVWLTCALCSWMNSIEIGMRVNKENKSTARTKRINLKEPINIAHSLKLSTSSLHWTTATYFYKPQMHTHTHTRTHPHAHTPHFLRRHAEARWSLQASLTCPWSLVAFWTEDTPLLLEDSQSNRQEKWHQETPVIRRAAVGCRHPGRFEQFPLPASRVIEFWPVQSQNSTTSLEKIRKVCRALFQVHHHGWRNTVDNWMLRFQNICKKSWIGS